MAKMFHVCNVLIFSPFVKSMDRCNVTVVGRRDAGEVCRSYELVIADFQLADVGLYTCCQHGDDVNNPIITALLTISGITWQLECSLQFTLSVERTVRMQPNTDWDINIHLSQFTCLNFQFLFSKKLSDIIQVVYTLFYFICSCI